MTPKFCANPRHRRKNRESVGTARPGCY